MDNFRRDESGSVPGGRTTDGRQRIEETNDKGAERRALYGDGWPSGDLPHSIDRFSGPNPIVTTTDTGKRIYENPVTGVQVVEDLAGDYYRVLDPSLPGKRRYLDLDGNVPNNKVEDGRETGRTQAEYNQVTHFRIEK